MAESTLLISGGLRSNEPVTRAFDAEAMTRGQSISPQNGRSPRELVGCGQPMPGVESKDR